MCPVRFDGLRLRRPHYLGMAGGTTSLAVPAMQIFRHVEMGRPIFTAIATAFDLLGDVTVGPHGYSTSKFAAKAESRARKKAGADRGPG